MELSLVRDPSTDAGTFGKIYADGAAGWDSMEDRVREVAGQPVSQWKVKGETAIPRGRYRVVITPSTRFKRDLPLLLNVPGFEGIRIHPGNTQEDTEGCILPGCGRSATGVTESRKAFGELFEDIQEALNAGEQVWITVG